MSNEQLGQESRDITDLSEYEASLVCRFLDRENESDRTLYFESTVHNWDESSETLSVAVTFKSEHVALQALDNAVQALRTVRTGTEAA